MLKSIKELETKISSCTECLNKKYNGDDGLKHILICSGTGCLATGARDILEAFNNKIVEHGLSDKVKANKVGCFGFCSQGPFVKILPDNIVYRGVNADDVDDILELTIKKGKIIDHLLYVDPNTKEKVVKLEDYGFYKKQVHLALHGCGHINPEDIEEALGYDAFKGLIKALSMSQQEVIDEIKESGLRGRGGGGFPTANKWQFAYNQKSDEKYVICNGDEGDPGAFMDEGILEGNPLAVIEGMCIAGYAIGAHQGYFYVRAEYPTAVARLTNAIKQARELGLLGKNILGTNFNFDIGLRLGAGAFVCGEETALLNSIEGKRGMPRPRPPFPAVKGLWQKPSIINNVETLACVPYILRNGADEFSKLGTDKSRGTKVFALGGKVNNVGLVEVPMGITLKELIYDIGGGIPNGKKFKAIQTGGPSGGCLTEGDLDTPIDYDNLIAKGSMMGSGGAIVMDEDNCMVDVAKFYMDFICDESCGKCSPCRIGTKRMLEILEKITAGNGELKDLDELEELASVVKSNSVCGLGQTAANPILSTLAQFRNEYMHHIVDKHCPAHVCKGLLHFSINPDKCKGCTLCKRNCPAGAISGEAKQTHVIDENKCIKCGQCVANCSFNAIERK